MNKNFFFQVFGSLFVVLILGAGMYFIVEQNASLSNLAGPILDGGSESIIENIELAISNGDFENANKLFEESALELTDEEIQSISGFESLSSDIYPKLIRKADQAVVDKEFDTALADLKKLALYKINSNEVDRRINAVNTYKKQLDTAVPYEGNVPHLFTHSLVIYPELAFDDDFDGPGFRDEMLTVKEFQSIIAEMNKRNYILVNIRDLYSEDENGKITPEKLMLPPGKKPFVLSIDDVSYYEYMEGDGFAKQLEIDEKLNVATRVIEPDTGNEIVTLTGDMMPILDEFVLDNPGFSHLGAKGIIATTGYQGTLGYDIDKENFDSPDFEQDKQQATEVATRLKELGWLFASHSYTHWRGSERTVSEMEYDTFSWSDEIEPAVGETDIYVTPFGYKMSPDNPRFRNFVDEGFNIINPIANGRPMEYGDDYVLMYRTAIVGYSIRNYKTILEDFFDVDEVKDPARGNYVPAPPTTTTTTQVVATTTTVNNTTSTATTINMSTCLSGSAETRV